MLSVAKRLGSICIALILVVLALMQVARTVSATAIYREVGDIAGAIGYGLFSAMIVALLLYAVYRCCRSGLKRSG